MAHSLIRVLSTATHLHDARARTRTRFSAGLLERLKYLPTAHHEFPTLLLDEGDILFNRTNSPELVGKSAVFQGRPRPCSFASYLIRVRTSSLCRPAFLANFINSPQGRHWVAGVASQQVGQANVSGSKLQALRFPLPPLAE